MKNKKILSLILAAAMVVGSSMTVFADQSQSTDSTGESFDHVDTDVILVTLPTQSTVDHIFDYYVDPEGLIKNAGTLADGTTVSGNDDGVYFKQTVSGGNAADGYGSTSDAVTIVGQNSVDVDVTASAIVTATDAQKDIALVADQAALSAATGPALLMTLTVGSDSKAITSAGTTAKDIIAGVPNNFEVKSDGSKFVYGVKDSGLSDWESTTIKMSGKTNSATVPTGAGAMTVPKIKLTWTISKHSDYTEEEAYGFWDSAQNIWLGVDADTGFSATGLTIEVSEGGSTYTTVPTSKYSNDGGWVSINWNDIVNVIGSNPTSDVYVRITDGTTRYTFKIDV